MDDELHITDTTLSRSAARWSALAAAGCAIAALWMIALAGSLPWSASPEPEQVVDAQVLAQNFQLAVTDLRASGAAFAAAGDLAEPPASYQTALADLTSAMDVMADSVALSDDERDRWRETAMIALTAATDMQAQLATGGTDEATRVAALQTFDSRMAEQIVPEVSDLTAATFARLRDSRDDAATSDDRLRNIGLAIAAAATLLAVGLAWILPGRLAQSEDLSAWMESASDDEGDTGPADAEAADETIESPAVVDAGAVADDHGDDDGVTGAAAALAEPATIEFGVGPIAAMIAFGAGFDAELVRRVAVAGFVCDTRLDAAIIAAEEASSGWDAVLRDEPSLMAAGIDANDVAAVAQWVRHRPERWDGAGKPDGLAGDAIPIPSRILHAATVFAIGGADDEAADTEVVQKMQQHAATRLDARIVFLLEQLVAAGSVDELRDGLDNHEPASMDAVVETVCSVSNPLRDDTAA